MAGLVRRRRGQAVGPWCEGSTSSVWCRKSDGHRFVAVDLLDPVKPLGSRNEVQQIVAIGAGHLMLSSGSLRTIAAWASVATSQPW